MAYSEEEKERIFDSICSEIAEGVPLREICRRKGMPSYGAIYDWMDSDSKKASRFARAREDGFDAIAEKCLSIADEDPGTTVNGGTDSGAVQHQKLRVETRLKLLAKWSPKRYGEKLELAGDKASPVSIVLKRYAEDGNPVA